MFQYHECFVQFFLQKNNTNVWPMRFSDHYIQCGMDVIRHIDFLFDSMIELRDVI